MPSKIIFLKRLQTSIQNAVSFADRRKLEIQVMTEWIYDVCCLNCCLSVHLYYCTVTPGVFWDSKHLSSVQTSLCQWLGGFIVWSLVYVDWMCICVCVCVCEGIWLEDKPLGCSQHRLPSTAGFGCRPPRLAVYAEYRFPSPTLCPRLFGNEGQVRCLFSLPQMLLIGGDPRLSNRRTCFRAFGWLLLCIVAFTHKYVGFSKVNIIQTT